MVDEEAFLLGEGHAGSVAKYTASRKLAGEVIHLRTCVSAFTARLFC